MFLAYIYVLYEDVMKKVAEYYGTKEDIEKEAEYIHNLTEQETT